MSSPDVCSAPAPPCVQEAVSRKEHTVHHVLHVGSQGHRNENGSQADGPERMGADVITSVLNRNSPWYSVENLALTLRIKIDERLSTRQSSLTDTAFYYLCILQNHSNLLL